MKYRQLGPRAARRARAVRRAREQAQIQAMSDRLYADPAFRQRSEAARERLLAGGDGRLFPELEPVE